MLHGKFKLAAGLLATELAPATATLHRGVLRRHLMPVFTVRSNQTALFLVEISARFAPTGTVPALKGGVFGRELVAVVAVCSDATRKIVLPRGFSFLSVTPKCLLAATHNTFSATVVVDAVLWRALVAMCAVRRRSTVAEPGGLVDAPLSFRLTLQRCSFSRSDPITMDRTDFRLTNLRAPNTDPVPFGGQSGVFRLVLVTALAVRAVCGTVATMTNDITQVVRLAVPAQIAQAVVCRIAVRMATERSLGRRSHKCLKYEPMDATSVLAPLIFKVTTT